MAQAARTTAASVDVPALFLSDIHFDPFTDPALVARLDAAPSTQWKAILATPASSTQKPDAAALQTACPVRAADTSEALWESSLAAIRRQTANPQQPGAQKPRFVLLAGDLLAHSFDCKYRFLLPTHNHDQLLAFEVKTLEYLITGLRATVPAVPVYTALGNNDTACGGNRLDPDNDFLAAAAPIVAQAAEAGPNPTPRRSLSANTAATPATRAAIAQDLASGGYYSLPIPALDNTRLLVLDDIFFLTEFSTCEGKKDYTEESAELAWLADQLAQARARHEQVWILGHIPPGVALYSTVSKRIDVCGGNPPWMAFDSTRLAELMAANADLIRLAVFGHTHFDEMALLRPGLGETPPPQGAPVGIPVKFIPSVSPINLNNPTFTLASIDPRSATLQDYTTFVASNSTGVDTTWSKEYSYRATYAQPDFSSASVASLISAFRADRTASTPASQAYVQHFFSGNTSFLVAPLWPMYVCGMDHQTGPGFAACLCGPQIGAPK